MKYLYIFLLLFCVIYESGCNAGKIPLKGKITFSDDGSPLTRGIIVFSSPTFQAYGDIQSDGTFRVSSTGKYDGLPPGEYGIHIINTSVAKEGSNSDNPDAWIFLVDEKYDSAQTSGLKLKIDSQIQNYDIVVDRYIEKRKK
ncbi:MAG: hypothetical protein LBC20_16420 [Planctomycetaceae bacterium]|jgi:hypothetical protein|nr:hypothetical protein [Planctomycetaceae bacterium]